MPIVMVDIDVGDVIGDITTEELVEELESRQRNSEGSCPLPNDYDPLSGKRSGELLEAIYEARRNGDDVSALELIDRLVYAAIGRIV